MAIARLQIFAARIGFSLNKPALLVVLLCSLGVFNCVDERAFYIVQNQVPEEGCEIPGGEGTRYQPRGLLDVSRGVGYQLFPLVRNDLPQTTGRDQQPERNNLTLRRFEVRLDLGWFTDRLDMDSLNESGLTEFSVPTAARLAPGATRSAVVPVIPDALVDQLDFGANDQPTIYARVTAIADHGGEELESMEFSYPIELCDGCLVNELTECPKEGDTNVPTTENQCGLPQDQPVNCCRDNVLGEGCLRTDGVFIKPRSG